MKKRPCSEINAFKNSDPEAEGTSTAAAGTAATAVSLATAETPEKLTAERTATAGSTAVLKRQLEHQKMPTTLNKSCKNYFSNCFFSVDEFFVQAVKN